MDTKSGAKSNIEHFYSDEMRGGRGGGRDGVGESGESEE
jgi:hypothetical protein